MSEVREECGIEMELDTRRKRDYDDGMDRSPRTTSTSDTNNTNSSNSRTQSRSKSGDTTGDSASSRVIFDEFDDTLEFIPFALVDDLYELDGAFEYGMCDYI